MEDRGREIERRVRQHTVRTGWERELQGIALEDRDGAGIRETLHQPRCELRVDFDREDVRSTVDDCSGDRSGPRAELDNMIRGHDAGVGNEASL
jgi:hypothetical protein